MSAPRGSSLPSCPLCTEVLGTFGGPTTLPCGHNGCVHCFTYLAQRSPECPLCRASFPADLQLVKNYELAELMRMAQALTAVEGEDEWQAVTSAARVDDASCRHAACAPAAPPSAPAQRIDLAAVMEGASAVDLEPPQCWEPDSSSATCRAATCGKPFSFLLRPRHHCRCCGLLFCSACTTHMLLPPKFRLAQPQRVCGACAELLLPVQPLLAGSVAAAVHQPVHDVTDWSAPRSLLNPPLSASMGTSIYSATNILRQYVRSVGSLQPERRIPPAILRSCAGLAVLSVARVGAGWGVSVGSGVVVARSPEGGWSAPSALLSLASSLGWQIGVEVQDLVLVLRSQAALKAFCSSQLGVGGGASVAAGPVGRAAAARALAAVGGGAVVYSYSSARGCYAGVALEGIVLRPRDAVNQAFYGRKLSARQLLLGGAVAPPPAAASLYSALDGLLEHAGTMAGPQFLTRSSRAASEPGLGLHPAGHALPAATAVLPQAAGGDSSEDDWEPEEPTAPALPRVRWGRHDGEPSTSRAAADVANGLPWGGGSSAVASPTYDEASPWGNLFD